MGTRISEESHLRPKPMIEIGGRPILWHIMKIYSRFGINDFVVVNGRKVPTSTRQELITIRGIIAGEYTVNIYHFAAVTGQPVPVTVMVQKINPKVTIVAKETIDLHQGGDEKTAVRFTLDAKGEVTETNRIQRSILQTFQNSSKDGKAWTNGATQ